MKSRRKKPPHRRPAITKPRAPKAGQSTAMKVPLKELLRLQAALKEAQETLDAIRSGEVDAVVVSGANGNMVYSLAGAEQPYRMYVERMQEGAVTVSSDAVVLYCNQRFADMVQLPLERVISSDLRSYISAEGWSRLAPVFRAENETVKQADALRRPGGAVLPVNLTANRLPVDGPELMCLVVTDLTGQIEHEAMRLARDRAEKANHAKDSFLAVLSHELRTPLNPALMSAIALEQDETLPAHVRGELTMIRRNIEIEARLIDDLLDLTRIAQGKLALLTSHFDLHTVVQRTIEICRPEIEAKNLQLVVNLRAAATCVLGDPMRVQQALWNLLSNAVKFTPARGVIAVSTGNSAGRVFAQVKDSGIGFEPSALERIFQAFEQGGRHITRQFGGLGLGLAISRSVAEAHGGVIRAESAGVGAGATFTLELPLNSGDLAEDAGQPAEPVTAADSTPTLRILLVEDHRDTRKSMEYLLRRARHRVWAAANAEEALRLADERRFDVVVTDLGLPDMSGLDLMQQLRDRHGLRGIATSGYGMEEDLARSRKAGFVRHFTKPISIDRLRNALAEFSAGHVPPAAPG